MPGSELANKIMELVQKADKLVANIKQDTGELVEAIRQLKEHITKKEDE